MARNAGVPDDARGVNDEGRGAGDVERVVRKADVRAPTLGARAVVVDQDREGEWVPREPGGDVFALLTKDDHDVEAVGLECFEAFAQLRDAFDAVGSPGAAVELDQERARARDGGGQLEGKAGCGRAGERGGGLADGDHGATFTATVRPSRKGTRVVTKSGAA